MPCKAHIGAVRDRIDELTTAGGVAADVVVVTFTKPRNLKGYRRRFADPFTVVTDQELALYRAMGFGRGKVARVWGWRMIRAYIPLLRDGYELEKTNEDTLQLGGNAIVAADGTLAWRYAGAGPDDRPSVDELVAAVASLP